MFTEMNVALPLSTRVLISVGDAMRSPFAWSVVLVLPLTIPWLLRLARRSQRAARALDGLSLLTPVFGTILRNATVARLARTLGTLLRSGVALLTALDASSEVIDNSLYRDGMVAIAESLRQGDPVSEPIERSGLFEPLFVQLTRAGEETGTLDAMLLRLAEYYELDVETAIAALGSILEPLLIIVLGAVVGTIVGSILVPLYSVIGSIK
jgi:type IV pilus assembly protein PilC